MHYILKLTYPTLIRRLHHTQTRCCEYQLPFMLKWSLTVKGFRVWINRSTWPTESRVSAWNETGICRATRCLTSVISHTHTQSHIPGLSVTSFHRLKCKCQHAVPKVNAAPCHPFNIKQPQTLMSDKHKPLSNNHNRIIHLKLLHRCHSLYFICNSFEKQKKKCFEFERR